MCSRIMLATVLVFVMSQMTNAAMPKCEQLGNADNAKLIQFLKDGQASNPNPYCVEYSIRRLGSAKAGEAIPVLVSYLSFRRPETEREKMGMGGALGTPSHEFPAISALTQIGLIALPALVEMIEKEGPDNEAHRNAVYAVLKIHNDGVAAIHFLRHSADAAKSADARNRLLDAGKETVSWCGATQRSRCDAAVTDAL